MMRSTVPVQDAGRVSIPAHIRRRLDVERGDLVEIVVKPVGTEEEEEEG